MIRRDTKCDRTLAALVCGAAIFAWVHAARAWDNGLARTPPMGWNSWNKYGCNVTDAIIRQNAAAMANSGMKAAGYVYINIDDCWAQARGHDGTINADSNAFPDMAALAAYVHGLGLKLGIYTDAGVATCQLRPGSYGHEAQDMATYAGWGIDYVKVDWCNTTDATGLHPPMNLAPHSAYQPFQAGITQSGRSMVLSACTGPMMNDPNTDNNDPPYGVDNPWAWGPPVANLWRTTVDISNSWASVMYNFHLNSGHAAVAGPGAWNDPDILEVGNGVLSRQEAMAHFSLWAMEAAPLIAGNDLSTMDANTLAILTNAEVIAIDQDTLGAQATAVSQNQTSSIWRKPLEGGRVAVAMLNEGAAPAQMSTTPQAVGLSGQGPFAVRDVWLHADANTLAVPASVYTALVPSHGVTLVIIGASGAATGGPATTGTTGASPPTSGGSTGAAIASTGTGASSTTGAAGDNRGTSDAEGCRQTSLGARAAGWGMVALAGRWRLRTRKCLRSSAFSAPPSRAPT